MTRADMSWALAAAVLAAVLAAGCPQLPRVVWFHDPLSGEEHAQLGAVYEREGKLDRAAEEYAKALAADPDLLVALTGMGNVALAQGRTRRAEKYYRRALELEPDNIVVLNNLAMALLQDGRPGPALEAAQRAVELDAGRDPRLLETKALAHLANDESEAARRDLEQAEDRCRELCPDQLAEPPPPQCGPDLQTTCVKIKNRLLSLPDADQ